MGRFLIGKYCINCKYSVYCNNRYLCVKHGKTIDEEDYCHDIEERNLIIYEEEVEELYEAKNKIYIEKDKG